MLELRHVSKRFSGSLAVDNVSFRARAGEVTGYLGPNGSGKSTTIKMIAGLIDATLDIAHADARPVGEPERMVVGSERGADLGVERGDAERVVGDAVAAQRLIVALALEQPDEAVGVAAFLTECGDLDAMAELPAGNHAAEMLTLVPVLHTLGDRDRCRRIAGCCRSQIVGLW